MAKRNNYLEDSLKEMKRRINNGSLTVKNGAWGYSGEQDEELQSLVKYINNIQ